jgi:hypothetical protein
MTLSRLCAKNPEQESKVRAAKDNNNSTMLNF